ncbi:putative Ubiquitin domain-containing protein [Helianthus anomalus]
MFSIVELPRTRDSFWRMAPRRNGGRREIWEALRQAAECQDLERKQQIINVNNIRLGNRDMTLCFDDTGMLIFYVCMYVCIFFMSSCMCMKLWTCKQYSCCDPCDF